jgi:transposase-like protein
VPRTRPPYPEEFRREAVRLAELGDKPQRRLAKDLGVSDVTLRHWLKEEKAARGDAIERFPGRPCSRTPVAAGLVRRRYARRHPRRPHSSLDGERTTAPLPTCRGLPTSSRVFTAGCHGHSNVEGRPGILRTTRSKRREWHGSSP